MLVWHSYQLQSLPDPTWMVENVVGVMEKVTNDQAVELCKELIIGDSVLEDIKGKCSTKRERELMHASIDIYVNSKTDSSWEEIARGLYLMDEIAAMEKVQSFLIPRGRSFLL